MQYSNYNQPTLDQISLTATATAAGEATLTYEIYDLYSGVVISSDSILVTTLDCEASIAVDEQRIYENWEGHNVATFTIELIQPQIVPITVSFTLSGDADYSSDYSIVWSEGFTFDSKTLSGTVLFSPGETSKSFVLTVINDNSSESTDIQLMSLNAQSPLYEEEELVQFSLTGASYSRLSEYISASSTIIENTCPYLLCHVFDEQSGVEPSDPRHVHDQEICSTEAVLYFNVDSNESETIVFTDFFADRQSYSTELTYDFDVSNPLLVNWDYSVDSSGVARLTLCSSGQTGHSTITVTAMDTQGLVSYPWTIDIYCIGLEGYSVQEKSIADEDWGAVEDNWTRYTKYTDNDTYWSMLWAENEYAVSPELTNDYGYSSICSIQWMCNSWESRGSSTGWQNLEISGMDGSLSVLSNVSSLMYDHFALRPIVNWSGNSNSLLSNSITIAYSWIYSGYTQAASAMAYELAWNEIESIHWVKDMSSTGAEVYSIQSSSGENIIEQRVFPEKNLAGELKNRIDLQVKIKNAIPAGKYGSAYLKIFDPVNTCQDSNGSVVSSRCNDNNMPLADLQEHFIVMTTQAIVPRIEFSSNHTCVNKNIVIPQGYAGDNFIATVHPNDRVSNITNFMTESEIKDKIDATRPDGLPGLPLTDAEIREYQHLPVYKTKTVLDIPNSLHTELLTVWRTLWVEIDQMEFTLSKSEGQAISDAIINYKQSLGITNIDNKDPQFGTIRGAEMYSTKGVPLSIDQATSATAVVFRAKKISLTNELKEVYSSACIRVSEFYGISNPISGSFSVTTENTTQCQLCYQDYFTNSNFALSQSSENLWTTRVISAFVSVGYKDGKIGCYKRGCVLTGNIMIFETRTLNEYEIQKQKNITPYQETCFSGEYFLGLILAHEIGHFFTDDTTNTGNLMFGDGGLSSLLLSNNSNPANIKYYYQFASTQILEIQKTKLLK